MRTFETADISFGGIRIIGDADGLELGRGVYLVATGLRGHQVAAWAVVVRIDGGEIGLEWAADDPLIGERVAVVIDGLRSAGRRRFAHTVPRRGPTWYSIGTAFPRRAA